MVKKILNLELTSWLSSGVTTSVVVKEDYVDFGLHVCAWRTFHEINQNTPFMSQKTIAIIFQLEYGQCSNFFGLGEIKCRYIDCCFDSALEQDSSPVTNMGKHNGYEKLFARC